MGSEAGDFSQLTLKHGCKCMPEATVSVEDCLIAVSEAVGGANIRSASRMNKAIEFFLSESQMVNDLIETGLVIKDIFVPVLPLSSPAKKVILSNVPPFVKNEKLEQILQMYGKIVSSIKMIPLGCKNPDIKHVMSFRRQVFMILNSQSDPLNLSVKLSIDGKDYTIFISSESMRCFVCGEFGHVRQTCPRRDRPTGLLAAPAADAENSVRAAGEDIVATAEASEPQPGEAFSAPGDVPEGRPVLEASGDGLAGAVEEAAGPSHIPAVSQAETSPRPVCLQSVTETNLIEGNQKQTDKIVNDAIIDNSFKQSQDDPLSQESVDLMDDSGNEHEDTEIMDNDAMDSELVTGVGDLSCPVCIELFSDPVLLSCGHSFCRRCIKDHWTSSNSRRCYVCRQVSPLPPVSNLSLRNACDSYLREQNTRIDGGLKCQIHREVIVLFCQTDGKAICATCKKHEHEWHVTLPLQQTVRQRKGKLKEALRSAEKTLLTLQNGTSRDSKISRYIKSQSQMTERRIRMEFEKLHQFLRKEEESRIAALNEEEKEKEDIIERQIQGGILSLSDRVKELEERIEDDGITLLKNYDGTMNRAKYTLPDEVALIDVPKHLGNLKYQVWEKMKDSCPYYPVILNPNTSSPNVVSVSDDLTSVTSCFRQQDETNALPLHRNRVVLGSVGYVDGVHTWDIEVGNSRHWTLGVCFGSVERSVVQPLTPKNGFWGLRCDGDSYRLMTAGMSRLNVKRNPEVVRVKIEYYSEDHNEFFLIFRKQKRWRKVSFSDARSDSFLAGFTRVPLENELFPFVIPEDQSVPLRVVPAKVILTVEQKLSFTERHRVLILICSVFVMVIAMILSWKKEQMNI